MGDLRSLRPGDAADWARLRQALWPEADPGALAAEITTLLGRPDCFSLGAFAGEALIGFAEAAIRPHGDGCETAPVAWLEGIYVDPSHRRRGVGRRLVAAVEDWARARGLLELGSDALQENAVSIATHLGWGFAETERVVMFRKRLR